MVLQFTSGAIQCCDFCTWICKDAESPGITSETVKLIFTHLSVCREMIFVLIVWPGHSRPVIKIHYLAPCSVVQADFREKIDSPDRNFCMDAQVGAGRDIK